MKFEEAQENWEKEHRDLLIKIIALSFVKFEKFLMSNPHIQMTHEEMMSWIQNFVDDALKTDEDDNE